MIYWHWTKFLSPVNSLPEEGASIVNSCLKRLPNGKFKNGIFFLSHSVTPSVLAGVLFVSLSPLPFSFPSLSLSQESNNGLGKF